MKKLGMFLLLAWMAIQVSAQKIAVNGSVIDGELNEPMASAAVALLKADSTLAAGASTDFNGKFNLSAKSGSYILRVSFMGYRTVYKNLTLTKQKPTVTLDQITLNVNPVMLKGAEVTARLSKVEMKEDTFVYNSSAYRVPEGSALEELVKKLPGAEVDEDGTIKINGKEVKKIMVDGKEFFDNDTKMAMKNLPTNIIDKIKAYDKQSDYAKMTGIDDGEEETVLDLSIKKGMNKGWMTNVDLGYGTEERYTGRVMVNRFTDRLQMSLIGSMNNTNDQGFPGGGFRGFGGGGSGQVTSKMVGLNFSWENGKKDREAGALELNGNVRYSYRSTDNWSKVNSERFLSSGSSSSFGNSEDRSLSDATSVNANFRLQWSPDSMTRIMFRPNFSYSKNNSNSNGLSLTFNQDPYAFVSNPLTDDLTQLFADSAVVNKNDNESTSDSESKSFDGMLMINRRLNSTGRNITLRLRGGYSDSESTSFSKSMTNYYLQDARKDYNHQYNLNPSQSYNYSADLSYSEPIFTGANLQFSYKFQYRYSDSDRSMYSLDSLLAKAADGDEQFEQFLKYRADGFPLTFLPGEDFLELCKNYRNSQYATYTEYNQEANVMFRYRLGDFRLNAGVSFQPQKTYMDYQKGDLDTSVVRQVFNWAPRVDLRYKISKTSMLRFRYSGRAGQPSMTNLLDVVDDSNPLSISRGNPGLKPSWTNTFFMFYNNYIPELQRGWVFHLNANMMNNNISTAVLYDEATGKTLSMPLNINGNWNTSGMVMFNSALGEKKYFNISTFTNVRYNNEVGYVSSNADFKDVYATITADEILKQTQKSTTRTWNLGERLNLNFRNDLLDLGVNGNINYQHARNDIQENANLDTYTFSYGASAIVNMPWNMSLSTDLTEESRRGYNDASMNTNELIWNAQLSQSFLKGNAATVSVQWYDILRQRSNISRTLSALERRDSWTNAINSYVMVHFIYRLNLMGGKEGRVGMPMGPGGGPGGHAVPMRIGFGGPR